MGECPISLVHVCADTWHASK